jgi:hypothetical protein
MYQEGSSESLEKLEADCEEESIDHHQVEEDDAEERELCKMLTYSHQEDRDAVEDDDVTHQNNIVSVKFIEESHDRLSFDDEPPKLEPPSTEMRSRSKHKFRIGKITQVTSRNLPKNTHFDDQVKDFHLEERINDRVASFLEDIPNADARASSAQPRSMDLAILTQHKK